MTYSVCCGKICYASGLTYREAEEYCVTYPLTDDIDENCGYEICEDEDND